jgi:hypothetical protein
VARLGYTSWKQGRLGRCLSNQPRQGQNSSEKSVLVSSCPRRKTKNTFFKGKGRKDGRISWKARI